MQDFPHTALEDVSPDGTKLCVYDTREEVYSFLRPNARRRKNPDGDPNELRVLDVSSGRVIYRGRFLGPVYFASFFSDSEALFLQTLRFPTHQLGVVDLKTGAVTERAVTDSGEKTRTLFATGNRKLVGIESNGKTYEALTQIDLPDYAERARVPLAGQPGGMKFTADPFFSSDRKMIAYSFEDVVVCRRTEDLGISWSERISPRLAGAKRLAFSADKSVLAVAVADNGLPYREYYTSLYDGTNGTEIARSKICGAYGMGLSPDGKILAVGDRVSEGAELKVQIYDPRSGRLLASLEQGEVRSGHRQFLRSFFDYHGIEFTSDGKYLITSGGEHIKVWSLPSNLLGS